MLKWNEKWITEFCQYYPNYQISNKICIKWYKQLWKEFKTINFNEISVENKIKNSQYYYLKFYSGWIFIFSQISVMDDQEIKMLVCKLF